MISTAGGAVLLERDLTAVLRDGLDGDGERGIVLLGPDRRALYVNAVARTHLRDGTPRGPDTLFPAAVQHWVETHCARMQGVNGAVPGELAYPSVDDRRLRVTIDVLHREGGPYFFVRTCTALPWVEPSVRKLQARFDLTLREAQVAGWVARGLSNAETAARLGIVEKTVKNVLMAVYEKLNVRNRVEMALRAHDAPVVPVEARV